MTRRYATLTQVAAAERAEIGCIARIRDTMHKLDVTQEHLAAKLGWPLSNLHRRLNRAVRLSVADIGAIAHELGVTPAHLLGADHG